MEERSSAVNRFTCLSRCSNRSVKYGEKRRRSTSSARRIGDSSSAAVVVRRRSAESVEVIACAARGRNASAARVEAGGLGGLC